MRVLVLNCGSATLKFDVVGTGDGDAGRVTGAIDHIGPDAVLELAYGEERVERAVSASSYGEALESALKALDQAGLLSGIEACGHRVVHGGIDFTRAVRIDDAVIEGIRRVSDLAPLHNARAIQVIEAARERFDVPMVACFDTSFYADLPAAAATYALPSALTRKHGIRRFGFHGLAHAYMTRRYRQLHPEVAAPRLVTLQLGSGCSATASVDGRPVQTSMGYTPLEGLVMGTRSGNIDPALALRLPGLTGLDAAATEDLLNKQSGVLGLSGRSADMREIVAGAASGDAVCELALDVFCDRVKEYIGAYLALLNGADAIVLGGGIGEHSVEVRRRVLTDLDRLGIVLDQSLNERLTEGEGLISNGASATAVWVMAVDEASVIASETAQVLGQGG